MHRNRLKTSLFPIPESPTAELPEHVVAVKDTVHLFCASLDQPKSIMEELEGTLDAHELTRASHFRSEQKKARFIVSHGLLRMLLGCYSGFNPTELRFRYGFAGKPSLVEEKGGDRIRFNMTHSNGLAAYGFTLGREIGVDLEYVEPNAKVNDIVNRFFTENEKAKFHLIKKGEKCEAFFRYWTCKEASLKASGKGLTHSLDRIEISLGPREPARLLRIDGRTNAPSDWLLQEYRVGFGFVGALVVQGSLRDVSH